MKTFEQFMSEPADDKDPYWGLFEINKVANQAVLNAVEYGYKKAEVEAELEIKKLKEMVFQLQNATIEMAENQKNLEYWNQFILDKVILFDDYGLTLNELQKMAEQSVCEKIQNNLIDDVPFKLVLVRATRSNSFNLSIKYEYLVVRSHA